MRRTVLYCVALLLVLALDGVLYRCADQEQQRFDGTVPLDQRTHNDNRPTVNP